MRPWRTRASAGVMGQLSSMVVMVRKVATARSHCSRASARADPIRDLRQQGSQPQELPHSRLGMLVPAPQVAVQAPVPQVTSVLRHALLPWHDVAQGPLLHWILVPEQAPLA